MGRPLWLGRGQRELFFASTLLALETVERYAGVKLQKARGARGHDARALRRPRRWTERFRPDTSFVEDDVLPAIRTPDEGAHCLRRLASLVQAA